MSRYEIAVALDAIDAHCKCNDSSYNSVVKRLMRACDLLPWGSSFEESPLSPIFIDVGFPPDEFNSFSFAVDEYLTDGEPLGIIEEELLAKVRAVKPAIILP